MSVRSRDATRGSARRPLVELVAADVDGDDRGGARLEQAVGEPAGRGAGVERAPPGDVDVEAVEGGGELLAAPADVAGAGADDGDGVARADHVRAGLVAGAPSTVTRPASMAARASSRCGTRPRRTSSASRRRRGRGRQLPAAAFLAAAFLAGAFLAAAFFLAGAFLAAAFLAGAFFAAAFLRPSWPAGLLGRGLLGRGLLRRRRVAVRLDALLEPDDVGLAHEAEALDLVADLGADLGEQLLGVLAAAVDEVEHHGLGLLGLDLTGRDQVLDDGLGPLLGHGGEGDAGVEVPLEGLVLGRGMAAHATCACKS